MIDAVIARLKSDVPELSGRVEGALQLAELQRRNALPTATPSAFVVPIGLNGGTVTAMAGAFIQEVTESVAVILVVRGHGASGSKLIDPLRSLIDAVLDCLAGWGPVEAPGVLNLRRGFTAAVADGAWIYQLEFSLFDQLRIAR